MVAHMAFGLSPHSTCTILITFVNMFPVKTVIAICFIRINQALEQSALSAMQKLN